MWAAGPPGSCSLSSGSVTSVFIDLYIWRPRCPDCVVRGNQPADVHSFIMCEMWSPCGTEAVSLHGHTHAHTQAHTDTHTHTRTPCMAGKRKALSITQSTLAG